MAVFKSKTLLSALFVFLTGSFFILSYIFIVPWQLKYYLNNTPMGKWLAPARASLKKSYNIVHLPYWLKKPSLPAYYINLSKDNTDKLISSIPFNTDTFSYGYLLDEDKRYVKAVFASQKDRYASEIKVRYRGIASNNWDAEQKALKIKFPKDNLFLGMASLNLFLPYDRAYFGEALDAYRAKKLSLISPEFKFVRVFINGKDSGVYLAAESWSKEFLARNNVVDTNNIFSNKDVPSVADSSFSYFSKAHLSEWKSYTAESEDGPFEELNALVDLVERASDEEFAKKIDNLLDLEKFYQWQLVNILAGSQHPGDQANLVLLFRQETGKFEPVPWDVGMYPAHDNFYETTSTLTKRILHNQKFLAEYKNTVNKYTSNEENLKDDLSYYDNLYQKYFYEFYKDQAKLDPDYVFEQKIKEYRSFIIDNFKNAEKTTALLKSSDFFSTSKKGNLAAPVFNGSFKHFNKIFLDAEQFLLNHPQFTKRDERTLILPAGAHIFYDVTIVPEGLNLIIKPGAELIFGRNASLISYSPVAAVGSENAPIIMKPLNEKTPWGVFGVINTGAVKNRFEFIRVRVGSSATINGVLFTSQFSLHNALSLVANSIFEESYSDDAFHAISGRADLTSNIFRNTTSDGADLDYISDSNISGNFFFNAVVAEKNLDGDGLDISGTANVVVKNNQIVNFGDKCISVGENAKVELKDNILSGCNIGMAVKDGSHALIDGNIIFGNKDAGIALYRKKPEFIFGGRAEISDSIIWGNNKEISVDEITSVPVKTGIGIRGLIPNKTSAVTVKNSTIRGGFENGENILLQKPDFGRILPAFMLKFVKEALNN